MLNAKVPALFVLMLGATAASGATPRFPAPFSLTEGASVAYQSFLSRFWVGPASSGHFMTINGNTLGAALSPPLETEARKGWLWQYVTASEVPYVYWRVTGSADALARLKSEWAWVKGNWSPSDLSVCGNVTGTSATALDDSAWVIRGLLHLYEATQDAAVLTYAENALDCTNNPANGFLDSTMGAATHWYDTAPISALSWSGATGTMTLSFTSPVPPHVGWLFNIAGASPSGYNGTFTALTVSGNTVTFALASNPGTMTVGGWYHSGEGKPKDILNYALAEIAYYNAACPIEGGGCPTALAYYNAAKVELDWANSVLERSRNANCPQTDHLYWGAVNYGTPPIPSEAGLSCPRANVIHLANSVVSLVANMAGAAANAMVSAHEGNAAYATQAAATTASILALEIDTCGAWLDDRDARVGAYMSYDFVTNVLPILDSATATAVANAFVASSRGTTQNNRGPAGVSGGDWCGPFNGVWAGVGFSADQIEIAAEGAILAIVAAGL